MSVIEQEVVETTTEQITARDVFYRAAYLIEEFGHTKFDIGAKNRGFCAIGAIDEAEADLGLVGEIALPDNDWFGLMNWNNAPETTGADVAARLREFGDQV